MLKHMFTCPCGEQWWWDACHDIFVDDDGNDQEQVIMHKLDSPGQTLTIYICRCGKVYGAIAHDEGSVFVNGEFKDVNWDL